MWKWPSWSCGRCQLQIKILHKSKSFRHSTDAFDFVSVDDRRLPLTCVIHPDWLDVYEINSFPSTSRKSIWLLPKTTRLFSSTSRKSLGYCLNNHVIFVVFFSSSSLNARRSSRHQGSKLPWLQPLSRLPWAQGLLPPLIPQVLEPEKKWTNLHPQVQWSGRKGKNQSSYLGRRLYSFCPWCFVSCGYQSLSWCKLPTNYDTIRLVQARLCTEQIKENTSQT